MCVIVCHHVTSAGIFQTIEKRILGSGWKEKAEDKKRPLSMKNEKAATCPNHKKAKPENRAAFRLRFMSCERCLLCCGIGKEGTLFPPFLLFLFLQLLLGFHFLLNLFQRLDRFRFLTLEPLEIDVLYKLWKRHFPRFRSGLESSSSQVLKSIF